MKVQELKEYLDDADDWDDIRVTVRMSDGHEVTGEVTRVYIDKDEVEVVVEAVEKEDYFIL